MAAYAKPQQWKKKGDKLAEERDKIKYIDLRFDQGQVVGFGKEEA